MMQSKDHPLHFILPERRLRIKSKRQYNSFPDFAESSEWSKRLKSEEQSDSYFIYSISPPQGKEASASRLPTFNGQSEDSLSHRFYLT